MPVKTLNDFQVTVSKYRLAEYGRAYKGIIISDECPPTIFCSSESLQNHVHIFP